MSVTPPCLDDLVLDVRDRLHELRCRDTDWLLKARAEAIRVQREAHVEELLLTRVLDERDALTATTAAEDGVSARSLQAAVETARALESLPRIAASAYDGRLSAEQLHSVVQLADEATDAHWAEVAPEVDPAELARRVRCAEKPSVEESRARRRAEHLRLWDATGMWFFRGALADLDGAQFKGEIERRAERMRPAAGQPWEPFEQRAARALVELVNDAVHGGSDHTPTSAARPLLQVPVPLQGPATICGIPLPDARVEQLRANATIEPVLVDDDGIPLAFGRRFPGLSPKIVRAVLLRDGQCQCGANCGLRHGLEVHHLVPSSWGGSDDISNLTALFAGHHPEFIPHGPWALVGNPNVPAGLRRVLYTDLTAEEARHYGLPPPPGST
jgi:HNH endonuclease